MKFIFYLRNSFGQVCTALRQTRGILSQKCDTLTAPLLFLEVFFFSVKSLPVFLGKVNHLWLIDLSLVWHGCAFVWLWLMSRFISHGVFPALLKALLMLCLYSFISDVYVALEMVCDNTETLILNARWEYLVIFFYVSSLTHLELKQSNLRSLEYICYTLVIWSITFELTWRLRVPEK